MKEKSTLEFAGSIFGNLIGIAIINSYMYWRDLTHGVLLDTFIETVWAANVSMTVQIIGNLILVWYHPARLYFFIQLIFSAATLLSIIVFFIVFPVDFSQIGISWINKLLRIILIISMGGTVIAGITHLVRIIAGTDYKEDKNKLANR